MSYFRKTKTSIVKFCSRFINRKGQEAKELREEKIDQLVDKAFNIYGEAIKKLGRY